MPAAVCFYCITVSLKYKVNSCKGIKNSWIKPNTLIKIMLILSINIKFELKELLLNENKQEINFAT